MSGARVVVIAALAGTALAACGDDVPRLNLMVGGTGGASGSAGRGTVGGSAVGGSAVGGSAAGMGGRGGAGGSGGRGGAAGSGGMSGAAGGGGGGAAGSGGAAASGGRGGSGGGAGGWGPMTPGYSGCSQVGGVDRIRVTKLASTTGLCFDFTIWLTTRPPPAGLTLPKDWALMSASARRCTSTDGGADASTAGAGTGALAEASAITGSVDWPPQIAFNLPPVVNVDVTLTFANDGGVPASEKFSAQNVDVRSACSR